jgi:hypothetical protein
MSKDCCLSFVYNSVMALSSSCYLRWSYVIDFRSYGSFLRQSVSCWFICASYLELWASCRFS